MINSLSKLNHIDSILTKSTIATNSVTVFGMPEKVAQIAIPTFVAIFVLVISQVLSWYFKKADKQLKV